MPIRWRLTLFNALAIGAILLLLGIGLFFLMRESLLSGVESNVESRAKIAARDLEVNGGSGGAPEVKLESDAGGGSSPWTGSSSSYATRAGGYSTSR